MDPNTVADALAGVLDTITGLTGRTFAYPPPTVQSPAGIVTYPVQIDFDQTYGRGMDRIRDWPLLVVVGKATDRTARQRILAYAAAVGSSSVKYALEHHDWSGVLDELTVTSVEFDVIEIADVPYISALFHLDIAGRGTS